MNPARGNGTFLTLEALLAVTLRALQAIGRVQRWRDADSASPDASWTAESVTQVTQARVAGEHQADTRENCGHCGKCFR